MLPIDILPISILSTDILSSGIVGMLLAFSPLKFVLLGCYPLAFFPFFQLSNLAQEFMDV